MSSIDIDEILSYAAPSEKKRRIAPTDIVTPAADRNGAASANHHLPSIVDGDAVESALASEDESPLDEAGVRKIVSNLEKKLAKNQEMRIKFSDDASKFLNSELELNTAIQEMHSIATVPSLYGIVVETNALDTLLQLLGHENIDIVAATVHLLQELTDIDEGVEGDTTDLEGVERLVSHLVEKQGISLLVHCMERFNEMNKDESDGVHNAMTVVENLIDFKPEVCNVAVRENLLAWLMRRIRQKGPFDGNKLYAGELLAVILQQSDEARVVCGERDGIDVLLQCLAAYKRHNPSSSDEREHMENLFNCLCAALMIPKNRTKFLDGEGLQLMNLMLREKKNESRFGALKVVDYATNGADGVDNCNKFVEILGLRTLFPLFMRCPSRHSRKDQTQAQHEEHVCAIISSLLRSCNGPNRERILAKFVEEEHVKVDRLIELHFRYLELVRRFSIEHPIKPDADDDEKDAYYMDKLDAGLFTLQLIDLIIADICVNGRPSIRSKVVKLLSMKAGDFVAIKNVLNEYIDNLGPSAVEEKRRLTSLIDKL